MALEEALMKVNAVISLLNLLADKYEYMNGAYINVHLISTQTSENYCIRTEYNKQRGL